MLHSCERGQAAVAFFVIIAAMIPGIDGFSCNGQTVSGKTTVLVLDSTSNSVLNCNYNDGLVFKPDNVSFSGEILIQGGTFKLIEIRDMLCDGCVIRIKDVTVSPGATNTDDYAIHYWHSTIQNGGFFIVEQSTITTGEAWHAIYAERTTILSGSVIHWRDNTVNMPNNYKGTTHCHIFEVFEAPVTDSTIIVEENTVVVDSDSVDAYIIYFPANTPMTDTRVLILKNTVTLTSTDIGSGFQRALSMDNKLLGTKSQLIVRENTFKQALAALLVRLPAFSAGTYMAISNNKFSTSGTVMSIASSTISGGGFLLVRCNTNKGDYYSTTLVMGQTTQTCASQTCNSGDCPRGFSNAVFGTPPTCTCTCLGNTKLHQIGGDKCLPSPPLTPTMTRSPSSTIPSSASGSHTLTRSATRSLTTPVTTSNSISRTPTATLPLTPSVSSSFSPSRTHEQTPSQGPSSSPRQTSSSSISSSPTASQSTSESYATPSHTHSETTSLTRGPTPTPAPSSSRSSSVSTSQVVTLSATSVVTVTPSRSWTPFASISTTVPSSRSISPAITETTSSSLDETTSSSPSLSTTATLSLLVTVSNSRSLTHTWVCEDVYWLAGPLLRPSGGLSFASQQVTKGFVARVEVPEGLTATVFRKRLNFNRGSMTVNGARLIAVQDDAALRPNPLGFSEHPLVNLQVAFEENTVIPAAGDGNIVIRAEVTLPAIPGFEIDADETAALQLPLAELVACAEAGSWATVARMTFVAPPSRVAEGTAAANTVVTTASIVASLSGGGGPLAGDQQSLALMAMLPCADPFERKMLKNVRMLAPAALSDSYSGLVLGNVILVFGVALLHIIVVAVLQKTGSSSWANAASRAWFPSITANIAGLAFQGSIFASARMLFYPTDASEAAIGFGGFALALLSTPVFLLAAAYGMIDGRYVTFDYTRCPFLDERPSIKPWMVRWFFPIGRWRPFDVCNRYRGILTSIATPHRFYVTMPYWTPMLMTFASLTPAGTTESCFGQMTGIAVLQWVVVLAMAVGRPFRSRLANVLGVLSASCLATVLTCSTVLLTSPGHRGARAAMSIAVQVQMGCTLLRFVQAVAIFFLGKRLVETAQDVKFYWRPLPCCVRQRTPFVDRDPGADKVCDETAEGNQHGGADPNGSLTVALLEKGNADFKDPKASTTTGGNGGTSRRFDATFVEGLDDIVPDTHGAIAEEDPPSEDELDDILYGEAEADYGGVADPTEFLDNLLDDEEEMTELGVDATLNRGGDDDLLEPEEDTLLRNHSLSSATTHKFGEQREMYEEIQRALSGKQNAAATSKENSVDDTRSSSQSQAAVVLRSPSTHADIDGGHADMDVGLVGINASFASASPAGSFALPPPLMGASTTSSVQHNASFRGHSAAATPHSTPGIRPAASPSPLAVAPMMLPDPEVVTGIDDPLAASSDPLLSYEDSIDGAVVNIGLPDDMMRVDDPPQVAGEDPSELL